MTRFCFYCGDDPSLADRLRPAAASVWGPTREHALDAFRLVVPEAGDARAACGSDDVVGAVAGYVRYDGPKQAGGDGKAARAGELARFLGQLGHFASWPLGDDWTGSFSAVSYRHVDREVVVANDPLGCWPLYYATPGGGILGGTSLIILGRALRAEVDPLGVLQRITPPYCNYGPRTLLQGVARLLPGQRVAFCAPTQRMTSAFDTSLCRDVLPEDLSALAELVWQRLKHEIVLAAEPAERVAVGLSGGWDSRLVLGGLAAGGFSMECLTYGDDDHYESRLARRCATVVGASHRCFPIAGKYFPSQRGLEAVVQQTESANYMEWYSILDGFADEDQQSTTLFLGDLCESVVGRHVMDFTSRRARVRSFARGLIGLPDPIAAATPATFQSWREQKREQIVQDLHRCLDRLSPALQSACTKADLAAQTESDLAWSFARVWDHRPPFAPMLDELFAWFHRVRFLLANQLPFLAYRFRPVCPALSTRFLRLITCVPPRLRIRRRLINAIIAQPDFRRLNTIPSAQMPWLSGRTPAALRDVVWGIRSGLDQMLLRAVLLSGNAWKRQRVLRSLDLIKEYRRDGVAATVESWFSGKWLDAVPYVRLVRDRAALDAWPLIGVDISAPANVSITLDLCGFSERLSAEHPGGLRIVHCKTDSPEA